MFSSLNRRRIVRAKLLFCAAPLFLLANASLTHAQHAKPESTFAPRNVLGAFGSYSPNSSHILLGGARNRILVNAGVSYERRLMTNSFSSLRYSAELAPIAYVSDPVQKVEMTVPITTPPGTYTFSIEEPVLHTCRPLSGTIEESGSVLETYVVTCSRRWTMGTAFSPAGLELSFRPAKRLQPFFNGHGGFMYSTQPIPISGAGSFNFTFDIGTGIELFTSNSRAISIEYRYHHISNNNTASANPGIDNGLIQFTYKFGWGR